MSQRRTLLVTGGSGYVGGKVLKHLLESSLENTTIIATTRSPEKLADLAAKGVVVRKCDMNDSHSSLVEAFKGVDRLLYISTNDLREGQRAKHLKAAVDAAVAAGVVHFIYDCASSVFSREAYEYDDKEETQKYVVDTKMDYTFVKSALWLEATTNAIARHTLQTGVFYGVAGNGKVPFVSRDEFALILASELASNRNGRSSIIVTGPQAYTGREMIQLLSEAAGKKVNFIEVTKEEKEKVLSSAGFPPQIAATMIEMLVSFDTGAIHAPISPPHPALRGPRVNLREFLEKNKDKLTVPPAPVHP